MHLARCVYCFNFRSDDTKPNLFTCGFDRVALGWSIQPREVKDSAIEGSNKINLGLKSYYSKDLGSQSGQRDQLQQTQQGQGQHQLQTQQHSGKELLSAREGSGKEGGAK